MQVAKLLPDPEPTPFIARVNFEDIAMLCDLDISGSNQRLGSEFCRLNLAMPGLRHSRGEYPYGSERTRIAAYHGYIFHPYSRFVMGSLRQWIPRQRVKSVYMSLKEAMLHKAKWEEQLSQTFAYLEKHEDGRGRLQIW